MKTEHKHTLPADVARCAGVGSDKDGWREGCDTCLRRLCPGTYHMEPPKIITLFCPYYIGGMNAHPTDHA